MTASTAPMTPTPPTVRAASTDARRLASGAILLAGGCALLTARPAIVVIAPRPVIVLVVLFVALLVVGVAARLPRSPARAPLGSRPTSRAVATAFGIAAVAAGRLLIGGHPPVPATVGLILVNSLAAVAEEAWFRRLAYGMFAPAGAGYAIAASAVLFAAVHVSIYGAWVLPLDLAAGLVLGWQRAATGSWSSSAVTHVVANLLVVL